MNQVRLKYIDKCPCKKGIEGNQTGRRGGGNVLTEQTLECYRLKSRSADSHLKLEKAKNNSPLAPLTGAQSHCI